MSTQPPIQQLSFPVRKAVHAGEWIALYLEPKVGSGERICIGVVASDSKESIVRAVPHIDRLVCAIGQPAMAIAWAAEIALLEIQSLVSRHGLAALRDWRHKVDGLVFGDLKMGAGRDLADLAKVALRQVSVLAYPDSTEELVERHEAAPAVTQRLDRQIRSWVTERRPQLRDSFGKTFSPAQSARTIRFGYVGRKLVANFASLTATATTRVGAQVDKAKARLWDLQQLNTGVLADSLPWRAESLTYELLVLRPSLADMEAKGSVGTQLGSKLREAEEELEAEADKAKIRLRAFPRIEHIGLRVLQAEDA